MALVSFVTFAALKILDNLFSMQNSLDANNCWCKQNLKNCPTWPYLYFKCSFRTFIWFSAFILSSFQLFLLKRMLLDSHGFYRKRECVTMHDYGVTCKGICSIVFWYSFYKSSFWGALFKRIFQTYLVFIRDISKRQFLEWNCSSSCNFSFAM